MIRIARAACLLALAAPLALNAQTAADTPHVKVGGTIFMDYTYNTSPAILDADSNRIHPNQFNVGRAYINVTGNVSRLVSFRITPDIVRETGPGTSLNGSLAFRLKYAFGQLNLDDVVSKGSWIRLGLQQTPWLDFMEGIYRYRFQGPAFPEREGYLSASDFGLTGHYLAPSRLAEVHVGVYNGENYAKPDANNQKALELRATLRPFVGSKTALQGLSATVFLDADHYVSSATRRRTIGSLIYEHKHLNAGAEYLWTRDRTSVRLPRVDGKGFSVWATPKTDFGVEAMLRYERLKPSRLTQEERSRTIAGLAYWFPHIGSATAAIMADYESTGFDNFIPSQPNQNKLALHGLINF